MKSPARFSVQHTVVTLQSLRSQNSKDHNTRYNFVFQGATGPRSRRTPCRGPATRRTAVMASCSPRCGHLRTLAPTRVWPTTGPLSRSTVKRKQQPTHFSREVFTRYLNAAPNRDVASLHGVFQSAGHILSVISLSLQEIGNECTVNVYVEVICNDRRYSVP